MRTTIGEQVRTLRLRRGLTQARLAHLVGRSERWLIDVEGGGVDPRLSDAVALATVLCVALDDLAGRSAVAGERFGRPPPRPPVLLGRACGPADLRRPAGRRCLRTMVPARWAGGWLRLSAARLRRSAGEK